MAKEKNKTELPQVMEGELQARLIKLREDAGYDLSQMAAILCLSENVIVNLENEAFDLLPEPPYVRGYLRNYAKLGDEDASELISRYESLRGADAAALDFQIKSSKTITTTSQKRMSPIWAQVIMLGVLLGGIGLLSTITEVKTWVSEKWNSFSSQIVPSNAENNPSLLGQLPVPAPLPEDEAASSQQIDDSTDLNSSTTTTASTTDNQNTATQNSASENTSSESTSTDNNSATDSTIKTLATEASTNNANATNDVANNATNTSQVATDTQATTSSNTTEEAIPTDPNELINIKLVFNKEVWLRIKDKDNKTVFEGLNKEGTEKAIDLPKPLTFRVGNAQGITLFIDNKAVDISTYINGSIANFTLE